MTNKVAAIRIRIGRLIIDADALAGAPHVQFAERLQREIVARLAGEAHGWHGGLSSLVAGAVAARVSVSAPLTGPIPSLARAPLQPGSAR